MEQQSTVEFSIIVPIYKVEAYLHQCIDSILAQTYPNFELILVDDGSPDNCGKICDEYASKDARIKVIHKENGGVTIARKTGASKAIGEYVCWVDGDDYIGYNLLQQMHDIIVEYKPDMIAFGFNKFRDDGTMDETFTNNIPPDKLYFTHEPGFYEKLLSDPNAGHFNYGIFFPCLWTKVCKREIIVPAMLAVPDEVSLGEDVAATNQAFCQCNRVYVSSICEYYYRFNATSLSNTFKRNMLPRWQALFEFINTHMDKIPQENKDAYICMEITHHIASSVQAFNHYSDFMHCINTEMTPELHNIVDRCKIPKLSLKRRMKFVLLKKRWYWAFWLKYHTFNKDRGIN